MTGARLGAWAAALAAGLSGCAAPTGGGGALGPSGEMTPPASVTRLATPRAEVDPLSGHELARHHETLAAQIVQRTALHASPGGRVLFHVTPKTAFGSPRSMAVLRRQGEWLGVAAEDLGNGVLGWVRRGDVRPLRVTWKLRIDLSQRRGWLLHRGEVYARFAVGIGTAAYPTPTGRFGVSDRLIGSPDGSYGCCALALTGHQPHIAQDWPGGDRIALHGTMDPASVGQAATHGCLRASDATMRKLMAKVPIGTQVVIRR